MCAVVDVMHTPVLYSIVSSCTALPHSRKEWALKHWQSWTGWRLYLTRQAAKLYSLVFHGLTSRLCGITNLTKIECLEQSGTLFLFAALTMHQVEGWHRLELYFEDVEAVLGTMECLLCFEAWLDQYTFWDVDDTTGQAEKAEASIASLMQLILKYLPKEEGDRWKVSKFHEIKHMVRFLREFGAPRGYNVSRSD